jgi:hypothetical protein
MNCVSENKWDILEPASRINQDFGVIVGNFEGLDILDFEIISKELWVPLCLDNSRVKSS